MYAYYSGRFGDDAPETSVVGVEERERVREKETAGRDGPLAPAARRAARLLLKKNDADADAEKRDVSDDVSASKEKEKEDVSREDREVFGSAADAILAAADAAADAARRADEKDRAAKRRGSRAAAPPPRADQSELEGPALAARGKALEAVAATAAKDSTVSRLVRARSKQAKEEVAELTPTALVAASFQGAAEVRFPKNVFSSLFFWFFFSHLPLPKKRCYTQLPGCEVPSQSFHAARRTFARRRSLLNFRRRRVMPVVSWSPGVHPLHRKRRTKFFLSQSVLVSTFLSSRALAENARKKNLWRPAFH